MNLDWTAIAGLGAALVAIAALVLETRRARVTLQTEALLSLSERFDSQAMRKTRQVAASKLLGAEESNYELADILDFFSTIAFLRARGAIDRELAYNQFSWWVIRYWHAARNYVQARRAVDRNLWITLERFVTDLQKRERKEGYAPDSYSPDMIRSFLMEEMRIT